MDNDRRLRLTGRLIVTGIRRMIVLKYEVTRSTQRVKAEKITGVESTQSRLRRGQKLRLMLMMRRRKPQEVDCCE